MYALEKLIYIYIFKEINSQPDQRFSSHSLKERLTQKKGRLSFHFLVFLKRRKAFEG